MVCLQHEYGIYGGPAGSFILALLRDLRIPVVTTLHTILSSPSADQRRVLQELAALSARLVVMSERGAKMLREIYGVPAEKIDLIPHGILDMPFADSNFYKDQFGVEGKHVILTFGLLSPNKGIESVLRTLPEVIKKFPNLVYIILGATHPNLVRDQGEAIGSLLNCWRKTWHQEACQFLQSIRRPGGAEDIPERGGSLHHALSKCGANNLGHAGLCVWQWQGGDFHALLARGGAFGRRPRRPRAVWRFAGHAESHRRLLQDDTRRHAMRKRGYLLGVR